MDILGDVQWEGFVFRTPGLGGICVYDCLYLAGATKIQSVQLEDLLIEMEHLKCFMFLGCT